MQIEHEPNMPALRREWLAARILAVIGGVLLLLVAGAIGLSFWPDSAPVAETPAAAAPPTDATAPSGPATVIPSETAEQARRAEGIALCTAAVQAAQNLGIVPGYATRSSDDTIATGVQGRYICTAKTDSAKYAVSFDLACTQLGDANCIKLYSVSQDGGGVLYQRK